MIGFAAAVVVGFLAGNAAEIIIFRAMVTMLICWCIGRAAGAIAQRAIDDHIDEYKSANPILSYDDQEDDQTEIANPPETTEGELPQEATESNPVQPAASVGTS